MDWKSAPFQKAASHRKDLKEKNCDYLKKQNPDVSASPPAGKPGSQKKKRGPTAIITSKHLILFGNKRGVVIPKINGFNLNKNA
jgi:hypothetical protein